jgi:hypothetical protein
MNGEGYLLLRREGGLFGVASADVRRLSRRGLDYRLETAAGPEGGLLADEVVGMVERLRVRPVGPLLRRYWPESAGGWAIHAGTPVLVVDPLRPPQVLREKRVEALVAGGIVDGE